MLKGIIVKFDEVYLGIVIYIDKQIFYSEFQKKREKMKLQKLYKLLK